MSSSASSVPAVLSFSSVDIMISEKPNRSRICSAVQPSALSSTVTGWRRLRSMRTPTVERLSTSNSSHAPRPGITLTLNTSTSDALSRVRSKYTPGERTSWLTTTRSVPLMMNVPLRVITGKSPMNTVWLLTSPVVLLMNSAVTNIGAEYVMSLSLHSSSEYFGGSNRWSRNERDMVPEKSSIGLISSKISSRPDCSAMSVRPACLAAWIRAFHLSLPSNQSNDSVCRASRSGTFRGSLIRAKDTRWGPRFVAEALRDAANRGPSELVAELSSHARQTPPGKYPTEAEKVPETL